jgi:two-component system NtrC family sensor kinase
VGKPLRILQLEDNPADAELVRALLAEEGIEAELHRVDTREALLAALERDFDVVLSDYGLPSYDGLTALADVRRRRPDWPFIVTSGTIGEERAVEALKAGATDYVLKDRLGRLPAALKRALEERDQKRARERAEAESRLQASLLDQVTSAVVATDRTGRIVYCNAFVEHVAQWGPRELQDRSILDVFLPGGEDRGEAIRRRLEESGLWEGEAWVVRRDGSQFPAFLRAAPTRDHDGRVTGFVVTGDDISDRKRSEEELRRQRDALYQSEKLAAMGQLLAGVAHELNNPLSVVMGQASLMAQTVKEGPLGARVEKIIKASERCARIVRNFLALARQHPPERRAVAINQVIDEAAELLAYPLRVDGVDVRLELGRDVPVLWADGHQLQQVLINLLTNAHQALRESAAPRCLTVTSRHDPDRARIVVEVADNGPGIPPEVLPRIFDPFFTTKPPGQGTGLGLPLCRGVVENHGGSLTVESAPGEGAVFRIELPVEPPVEPSAPVAEAPAATATTVSRRVILVVDDEREVAEILADFLRSDGHQVLTATDGLAALEHLARQRFDLVFSDLRMPGLDGPGLFQEVSRRHPGLERRFVFMTGDTLTPGTRGFLDRSGQPHLAKPLDLEQVRRIVSSGIDPDAA